ncbi:MAG: heavy-metal-associated domain-containing protein, partial [Alistipes sp.]|nr:heavy-metal-associated domain-containing protein [Alistipes sp.]
AAILVIGKVLGRKTLVAYLCSIIVGAMLFGLGIDYLLPDGWFSVASTEYAAACCHGVMLPWWKTASAVLFTALLVVALVRRHKTEKHENQTTITMEKAYKIKGMMCNHCKANVERNLAKLEGVESVRVDLAEGVAYVTGDVEPQKVIDLINDLGYEYLAD